MTGLGQFLRHVARFILAWLGGAITATLLGVIFQTQNGLARLSGIGADVSVSDRLSMTAYDVIYLGQLYFVFVALGALIAYLAGLLVYRLAGFGRPIIFAVAGGVAMAVMLMGMKQAFFGVQMIAGARDLPGFILQMFAGALGGLVFAWLSAKRAKPHPAAR